MSDNNVLGYCKDYLVQNNLIPINCPTFYNLGQTFLCPLHRNSPPFPPFDVASDY